jgi:hypothetical protein
LCLLHAVARRDRRRIGEVEAVGVAGDGDERVVPDLVAPRPERDPVDDIAVDVSELLRRTSGSRRR